jgi:hypothetical protein
VKFGNFRGAAVKPINPFPMIMMLIIVLLLMAWLGGYLS